MSKDKFGNDYRESLTAHYKPKLSVRRSYLGEPMPCAVRSASSGRRPNN